MYRTYFFTQYILNTLTAFGISTELRYKYDNRMATFNKTKLSCLLMHTGTSPHYHIKMQNSAHLCKTVKTDTSRKNAIFGLKKGH